MKVTRYRCAVLLLLLVSIIYGVFYVSEAGSYYSETGELPDDPVLGKIFVTPEPFSSTHEGRQFIAVGLGFLVLWCLTIYPPNLWKRKAKKTVALTLLFSMLSMMFSPIVTVYGEDATPEIWVDVLCAGDEEFMADPANMGSVEYAIQKANTFTCLLVWDSFEGTFGIHFHVVDWVTWDSDDDVHDPRNMAWEVWNETGFETGMTCNGRIIEMRLACRNRKG